MRSSRRSAAVLTILLTVVLLLTGCPKRPTTSSISAPAPSRTPPSATSAAPGSPSTSSRARHQGPAPRCLARASSRRTTISGTFTSILTDMTSGPAMRGSLT